MSSFARDDNVFDKYNKIWEKIKEELNIKFHSKPVYDEKYIKLRLKNLILELKPWKSVFSVCINFSILFFIICEWTTSTVSKTKLF